MFDRYVSAAALAGLTISVGLVQSAVAKPASPQNTASVASSSDVGPAVVPTKSKPVKLAAVATAPAAAKAAEPKVRKKAKKKPAHPTLKISIDLTRQRMTVREYGKTKHTFKISSGRKGYRTPTGHYRPQWMTKMHYSKKYDNAPMPHSIFFHRGYAIHATYATGRLGGPASHGCIRLSPYNAKRLYKLVLKHKRARTRIAISGVAKDRPRVARKKKTYRKTYNQATYKKRPRRTKKYKPNYTYSYAKPSSRYTWPGDAPRRRLRY